MHSKYMNICRIFKTKFSYELRYATDKNNVQYQNASRQVCTNAQIINYVCALIRVCVLSRTNMLQRYKLAKIRERRNPKKKTKVEKKLN